MADKIPITNEELFELIFGEPYNANYPAPVEDYLLGCRICADKLIEKGRQMEREETSKELRQIITDLRFEIERLKEMKVSLKEGRDV